MRAAIVGGAMYDRLYERCLPADVELACHLPHPELNAFAREMIDGSGARCDLLSTHTKYAPSQAQWLRPLDAWFSEDELAVFSPALLEMARIDGKLYGIPRNVDARLLHYRTDLLGGAGLELPATWEDLRDAAAVLTDQAAGTHGYVFCGRDSGLAGTFFEMLEAAGGRLFADGCRPAFEGPEAEWVVDYLRSLLAGGIVPAAVPSMHYDEVHAAFKAGGCAMVCDWPGFYASYRDGATSRVHDRLGLARMPAGPSGRRVVYAGVHTFAIPATARDPAASAELIRRLTGLDGQRVEAAQGTMVSRTAVVEEAVAQAADPLDVQRWRLLDATVREDLWMPPKLAAFAELEDTLWHCLRQGVMGELSPAQSLRAAAGRIEQLLETSTAHASGHR
jgi:multiple sugar transport system substrate-binding protein